MLIYNKIINGTHPRRPSEPWVTDDHWLFMQRCWSDYASGNRPLITDVVKYVNAAAVKIREEEYVKLRTEEGNCELPDLTGCLQRDSDFPSAGGGFSDIWRATWQRDMIECKVGVILQMPSRHFVTVSRWLLRYCDIMSVMNMLEKN